MGATGRIDLTGLWMDGRQGPEISAAGGVWTDMTAHVPFVLSKASALKVLAGPVVPQGEP